LLLDEIGDLPLELQPKLLRVMQERQFERLGGTGTIHTDVRVICATHRNLAQMVEERQFRADLLYRLSVFPIELPWDFSGFHGGSCAPFLAGQRPGTAKRG
jgi:transcriptional regulator with GAF, ATPase, and Fis domain